MIAISCAHCGKRFSVDESWAGKRAKCACLAEIVIPESVAVVQVQRRSSHIEKVSGVVQSSLPATVPVKSAAKPSRRLRWMIFGILAGISHFGLVFAAERLSLGVSHPTLMIGLLAAPVAVVLLLATISATRDFSQGYLSLIAARVLVAIVMEFMPVSGGTPARQSVNVAHDAGVIESTASGDAASTVSMAAAEVRADQ